MSTINQNVIGECVFLAITIFSKGVNYAKILFFLIQIKLKKRNWKHLQQVVVKIAARNSKTRELRFLKSEERQIVYFLAVDAQSIILVVKKFPSTGNNPDAREFGKYIFHAVDERIVGQREIIH
jgi:hypothetical protein